MTTTPPVPSRDTAFIGATFLLGVAAFAGAFALERVEEPFALGAIVVLAMMSESLSVRLYFDGRVSVSFVGTVVAAVLFGLPGGVLAASSIAATGYFLASRSRRKLAFNFGHEVVAAFVAAGTVSAMGLSGADHAVDRPGWPIFAGVTGAAILFTVDAWSVSAIMALTSGRQMRKTYGENYAWLLPHYLVLGAVGGGCGQAVIGQNSVHFAVCLGEGHLLDFKAEHHILTDGHMWKQCVILKDH